MDSASIGILEAPIVTEALVDEFVRHRLAVLTASIVRQAEENIAEELTRITQLVPLSKEGGTYARAPLASSPAPAFASPVKQQQQQRMSPVPELAAAGSMGSPGWSGPGLSRPQHDVLGASRRKTAGAAASSTGALAAAGSNGQPLAGEGADRLQALMDLVRSPRAGGSPTRARDSGPSSATTAASATGSFTRHTGNYYDLPQANTEHRKRMTALQQLADKFAKPQSIAGYVAPAPLPGTAQAQKQFTDAPFSMGLELSSARARQYAEQLNSLVDAGPGDDTGSVGSLADVRPVWRGSF